MAIRTLSAAVAIGASLLATSLLTVPPEALAAPRLDVTALSRGLEIPWGVAVAPDGTALVTQRAGPFVAVHANGRTQVMRADLSKLFAVKEAGLMGVTLDTGFADNRRAYTCQAEYTRPGAPTIPMGSSDLPVPWPNTGQEIKIVAWKVADDWTGLTRERTVLSGIPTNASGRHAGCGIAAWGSTLWISTGDNVSPGGAQNPATFEGKVLHINLDGTPAAGNPNPASPVYTMGHRNPQDVAVRPETGQVYVIEHGTDKDDELNLLRAGGNYGYSPNRAPLIYDESVPMTDPDRVPGAIFPVWRTGNSTLATAALAFLPRSGWGRFSGGLVVSTLKGKRLVFMRLSPDGRHVVETAEALKDSEGRLRGLAVTPDGALLVTTSNGEHADKVLRVRWTG
ncbi:MAG TPA: PQQ-dependent sugar dehydrogenase [Gordonia sp. (in: high G+C Gram-positive bacteria)]|uniref:PQQ-dependent sugar dehydrogenase n=1 Tax=unclassified Gordonia (in: high G+C Gram-positive bacteria) TaxID=2657482 RepID=UPI000FA551D7|nr:MULTISPECIES: PQQ-dependent sugar dehydrogenase [unclassified Gordonia (in: high G+C Gram-positive bacteria)]RTL09011.1 MAG: PQQ-dependent sugar dehydrogenase [Acidimicrobiia bacterium]HNP57436.1 PQQ-dependent sugar dehydrogenase [Gordonia sp. (in: high G+C Gram-positive bacteria)]HRC50859.1 PQQ-dependent sugar dehydrogenase [Gordonia sp. (in: high G+C Gram-positive bacteria)]